MEKFIVLCLITNLLQDTSYINREVISNHKLFEINVNPEQTYKGIGLLSKIHYRSLPGYNKLRGNTETLHTGS